LVQENIITIFKRKLLVEANETHLRILDLGIYSLILCSSIKRMIEYKVIYVFKSPITTILAETFSSLNHYRKVGNDHLRCFLLFFFFWKVSNIVEDKILGIFETLWNYTQN